MDGDVMEHEIWGHPRVAVHICDNEGGGTEMVFSGRGVVASRAWTAGWAHSAVVKSTHAPHVSRDHRLFQHAESLWAYRAKGIWHPMVEPTEKMDAGSGK